jgi:hypothetical protein
VASGQDSSKAKNLSDKVVSLLNKRFAERIPNVEDAQNIVIDVLKKNGFEKVAEEYSSVFWLLAWTLLRITLAKFPSEILYAMDIVPMHTEMTTWMTAMFLGEQAELLSAGAELGLAPEICSPHRGLAGAFLLKALPRPNVMLWSNMICDNTAVAVYLINHSP